MRSIHLLGLVVVVGGIVQTGCGDTQAAKQLINGTVFSEDGQPILGAKITVNSDPNQSGLTNPTGAFEIRATLATKYAMVARAEGYAIGTFPLTSLNSLPLRLVLRPIDVQQDVQIPPQGGTPPVVQIQREGGTSTLSIPANSLVDPQGNIVTGTVTVSMTYWSGLNNTWQGNTTTSWPGALLAKPDADHPNVIPLRSLGMLDIEVHQGDKLLQVAPGMSLQLKTTVPPILASVMDDPAMANKTFLFYLNPNDALWEKVSALGTAVASWDPNTKTFTGNLPHLSAWNWDTMSDETSCIQGTATDCSGSPYQGKVRVWVMTFEGLLYYDVPTVNGKWCLDKLPLPSSAESPYATTFELPIHVSGLSSPTDSSLFPNVIPPHCAACATQGSVANNTYGLTNFCECRYSGSFCAASGAGCFWGNFDPQILSQNAVWEAYSYDGVVTDKIVSLPVRATCSTGCSAAPSVKICTVDCSKGPQMGTACRSDADCCDPSLQTKCLDYLCVPSSD